MKSQRFRETQAALVLAQSDPPPTPEAEVLLERDFRQADCRLFMAKQIAVRCGGLGICGEFIPQQQAPADN